jgi:uncharacterized protein YndB with AHSA1/START domain
MSTQNLIAKAQTSIDATVDEVWKALIDPDMVKQYMFGTTVTSDWKEGSRIRWAGEWKGKKYEDKGKILELVPGKRLKDSHFSPLSGRPDKPEYYHIVTIAIEEANNGTSITLTQDKCGSENEKNDSEKNWNAMLESFKKLMEK